MKKVILIASPNDFAGNVNVSQIATLIAPPMGILAVGSFLAAHGVPVELVDVQGETTALQISQCLSQDRSFLSAQMPNLAWRDENEIHSTPIRPVAVDDLPIMDFRLLRYPDRYQIIELRTLLDAHPELMDDEGVITFGDSLRRFSPGFDPGAMLMRSDKKSLTRVRSSDFRWKQKSRYYQLRDEDHGR